MIRKRSTPWIHRWSRHLLVGIGLFGVLDSIYLTLVELKFFPEAAFCPTSGVINCQAVLESEYSRIYGIPLTIFGLLAYALIVVAAGAPLVLNLEKKSKAAMDEWTWSLLYILATGMLFFSGYLFYIMAFEIKAFCLYCLASTVSSIAIFIITIIGRNWEDIGQLLFTGFIVALIVLIISLGLYNITKGVIAEKNNLPSKPITSGVIPAFAGNPPWTVNTVSGPAETALAKHLTKVGIKEYGAFWCPHCHEQKLLFGIPAFTEINYIECDPRGKNAQPELCQKAGIQSFPSWEINGKITPGVFKLEELANMSGYTGARDFRFQLR